MQTRASLFLLVVVCDLVLFGCRTYTTSTTNANKQSEASALTTTELALPDTGFRVEWISYKVPSEMQAGKEQRVTVTLKNTSNATWPSKGRDGTYTGQVSVSHHWFAAAGDDVVYFEGMRTAFPHDIVPGETVTLDNVTIILPPRPDSYRLQLTLVQDGVAWFEQRGANTVTVPVTVR